VRATRPRSRRFTPPGSRLWRRLAPRVFAAFSRQAWSKSRASALRSSRKRANASSAPRARLTCLGQFPACFSAPASAGDPVARKRSQPTDDAQQAAADGERQHGVKRRDRGPRCPARASTSDRKKSEPTHGSAQPPIGFRSARTRSPRPVARDPCGDWPCWSAECTTAASGRCALRAGGDPRAAWPRFGRSSGQQTHRSADGAALIEGILRIEQDLRKLGVAVLEAVHRHDRCCKLRKKPSMRSSTMAGTMPR